MLYKLATLSNVTPLNSLIENDSILKTASSSSRAFIDPGSDKATIIAAEIKKHPTALFFRAKAIKADETNSNGDYFTEDELLRSYKSFEGVPFFTNHDNQNVENARGKIIHAEWVKDEKAVYVISFIDREAFPHICRSIEEEYVNGVSMGSVGPNTMIIMADGTEKKIKDVNVGEFVISPFGNDRKVLKTYSANLKKPMYKLYTEGYDNDTLFSNDHPVYVISDLKSEPSFVEVEKLQKGHFILVPLIYNGIHHNRDRINTSGKIIKHNDQLFYISEIQDIETVPYDEKSYDLTVEGDESYIADGIAVHNCSVEYSICSICHNRAEKTEDFCTHIRNRKGRQFTGKAKDVRTGELKSFKNADVFEYNYGIKFIELSAVVDPACPSCRIDGIYDNGNCIKRVANMQNELFMVKSSALEKQASQEDLDQLNQCLESLETIAVSLVQNRQQIEVEFASDLVSILSDLQKFTDELVGAGYANIQAVPGITEAPVQEGLEGQEDMAAVPVSEGMDATQTTQATPLAVETPIPSASVGSVSGSPMKPLVQGPQFPITAPAKPIAMDLNKLKKVANIIPKLQELKNKIKNIGEHDMVKRRTISERIEQKKIATEVLSNSWQEKQNFLKYIKEVPSLQNNEHKLSVKKAEDTFIIVAENKEHEVGAMSKVWTYEDFDEEERRLITESPEKAALHFLNTFTNNIKNQKEGVNRMTDQIKSEAGAVSVNKAPEVVQEAQLEQKRDLYHARTGDEQNSVTEKQLADDAGSHKRTGELDVITEAQLQGKSNKLHAREEVGVETITERQLDTAQGTSPRTGVEENEVTQAQLDSHGNRTGTDPDVITEKQLDNIASPWERSASRDISMFKSAGEHMSAVIDVIADSVIATGCTPEEACEVGGSMIESTKERYELGNAILDKAEDENIDHSKRLAYWNNKNIRVATVGKTEIADSIIRGLRKVTANETINPEVILDALDVISEDEGGRQGVSTRVDEKLEAVNDETVKASMKSELRQALKASVSKPEMEKNERDADRKELSDSVKGEEKSVRVAERKAWSKKASTEPDTKVVTDFNEIGISKKDHKTDEANFRSAISNFTRGALASQNLRVAAITNVTISGDTITIAVQTGEGEESIEIPVNGQGDTMVQEEVVPEGDLAGEGLDVAVGAPAPAPAFASSSKKMQKKAQAPMGGGIPQTPGGVAGGPGAPEAGLSGAVPTEDPVQSLTTDEVMDEEVTDEIPTAGEQQPLGAICPECGTSDVDVMTDGGNINGVCKNPECGAEWEALIKKNVEYKITKPSKLMVGGDEVMDELETPEVPALPVAAQTKLDKNSLVRIAANQKKHGHVCPACGMNQCKASSDELGSVKYKCPACKTDVNKDVIVNVNNPEESYLRVQWDISPNMENCADCDESVKKLVAMIKVDKMVKEATQEDVPFPMANCKEIIARTYGGNTSATFGPCKGKLLADCVCGQLEKLGLTKKRYLEKLASAYMQEDPMDECMEDQKKKGFDIKEATATCNCLKKKYASKNDDNPFIQAFAEDIKSGKEKVLTAQSLGVINDLFKAPAIEEVEEEDVDIADMDFSQEETVSVEVSKNTATELAEAATEATEAVEREVEVVKETPDMGSAVELEVAANSEKEEVISDASEKLEKQEINPEEEKEMAMAMQTHKLKRVGEEVIKIAGVPKVVKDIEGNVEAGVPRSKATMGNEGADNIDVPMAKPSVPRAKATMGNEGADNIDKPAGLPNVAVDSSYMGEEKSVQKDMPAINNDIKGTVIAEDSDKVIKEAKQLKEVDTVEGDVEAGVPRAKATIGEEGAGNIDVPMAKPSVPRANAEMGNEGADNINPKATGPDVPVDSAYMGEEKSVQKDMPAINDEMLKQVQMKKDIQLERIATARKQEAMKVSYKLLAASKITEEAFDDVVDALSSFQIDQIALKAESMYSKQIKTASVNTPSDVHTGPAIVLESKEIQTRTAQDNMTDQISSMFTIGNKSFDEKLTMYGEK